MLRIDSLDYFSLQNASVIPRTSEIQNASSMKVSHLMSQNSYNPGELLYVNQNEEKVAIIKYEIKNTGEDTTCYISFFGTQNAEPYSWHREIALLDIPDEKQKGLSYSVMMSFMNEYCIPHGVKRIYIDADLWTKMYWKEKMWKFLKEKWLIKQIWSQSQEVCFVLET